MSCASRSRALASPSLWVCNACLPLSRWLLGALTQEDKIFVYYCKYSGRHAMTTDCDIEKLPRRATDGAMVLDRTKYIVRLYTADGGVKYVKRDEGDTTAERQYRLQVGPLPVAYT